jgi:Abortive infection C-terminus
VLTDEIISAVARFFDQGRGPSHDELSRMFRRSKLDTADPAVRFPGEMIGKMKRVREVLSTALDTNPDEGQKLVKSLIGSIKASGGFRPTADAYAGVDVIEAAREAFRAEGFELDPEGNLHQALLSDLHGVAATDALRAYVRRAHAGSTDAALVVGTGKDLLEATARHVLVQSTGTYPSNVNFPATLYHAFDRLGLATSSPDLLAKLDSDAQRAVEQSLWLLGCAVNRLRNQEGTGHGRPFAPTLSDREARLAIQAMGVIAQLLLDVLEER